MTICCEKSGIVAQWLSETGLTNRGRKKWELMDGKEGADPNLPVCVFEADSQLWETSAGRTFFKDCTELLFRMNVNTCVGLMVVIPITRLPVPITHHQGHHILTSERKSVKDPMLQWNSLNVWPGWELDVVFLYCVFRLTFTLPSLHTWGAISISRSLLNKALTCGSCGGRIGIEPPTVCLIWIDMLLSKALSPHVNQVWMCMLVLYYRCQVLYSKGGPHLEAQKHKWRTIVAFYFSITVQK